MHTGVYLHACIFGACELDFNESIELECDSYFCEQHPVSRCHMIKLDVIKNYGSHQCAWVL